MLSIVHLSPYFICLQGSLQADEFMTSKCVCEPVLKAGLHDIFIRKNLLHIFYVITECDRVKGLHKL